MFVPLSVGVGSPAYDIGYHAGQVVFVLVCGAALWKTVQIARRPAANTKCALALVIPLAGFFLAALCGSVTARQPALAPLAVLAAMLAMGSSLAGVVLAIIGLVEWRSPQGRYTQGKTQAILALCLVGAQVVFVVVAAAIGFNQARLKAAQHASLNQPRAGELIEFEDRNFRFRAPGGSWVRVKEKELNSDSSLAFTRANPRVFCAVIAENLGADLGMTTSQLREISQAHIRSAATSAQIAGERPKTINGVAGSEFEVRGVMRGYEFAYVVWVAVTNGYAYQLLAWGRAQDAPQIRPEAEWIFQRFELMDSKRLASGNSGAKDFESAKFGYRVRIADTAWRRSDKLLSDLPGAEFAGVYGQDLALVMTPVSLPYGPVPFDAVARGLLATLGIGYPNDKLTALRVVEPPGSELSGREWEFSRALGGSEFHYRIQVLAGTNRAILAAAWATGRALTNHAALRECLARVDFQPTPASFPPLSELPTHQQEGQALVWNEIGLHFHKVQQYADSAAWFRAAFEQQPRRGLYLVNLLTAWNNQGRRREALDYLESKRALLPAEPRVRAWEAFLLGQTGQTERALTNYVALFDNGYEDEDQFSRYLDLLSSTREPDLALEAARKYLARNESSHIRLLQAALYKQKRDFTNAVAILRTQHEKVPFDLEVSYALGDGYCQAGLYADALALAQGLVRDSGSGPAHFLEGRAQFGLKRYREAKQAFERAHEKLPASNDVRLYLDHVSGMLGEGNNTLIKDPISPVPLPKDLASSNVASAPAGYLKGAEAQYLRRFTAIAFTPGKTQTTTDYLSVKVLDSGGVARFSTIQVAFDPLSETVFVNSLAVRAADGHEIATGSAADYYAVDAPSEGTVNQHKVLNIPVAGLQPGCTLELVVSRQTLQAVEKFQYLEHCFATTLPVVQSGLVIRGATTALKYTATQVGEPETTEEGLLWRTDFPPIYHWEPLQKQPVDFLPTVWVAQAAASWESEARDYLTTLRSRMHLPAALAEAAREAGRLPDPVQRVSALSAYVQTNYTYKGIEFGRRARMPQDPADILRAKYGDCKDHALLLQQMLEAAGVPARLALVKSHGLFQSSLPSLDQFDHMIVFVVSNSPPAFLDCTMKGADPALPVPVGLGGREALILDETAPRLALIPNYPAGSSGMASDRGVKVLVSGDVEIRETLRFSGYFAAMARGYLRGDANARRNAVLAQMNSRRVELRTVTISNLDAITEPLTLQLAYALKGQFQTAAGQLLGQIPSLWEHHYLTAQPMDQRVTPFQTTYPLTLHTTVEITAENTVAPDGKALAQSVEGPFITARAYAEPLAQGLRIQYDASLPSGSFPPGKYGSYREAMDNALRPFDQNLAFKQRVGTSGGN